MERAACQINCDTCNCMQLSVHQELCEVCRVWHARLTVILARLFIVCIYHIFFAAPVTVQSSGSVPRMSLCNSTQDSTVAANIQQNPQRCASKLPKDSPTARLTQTSLELSPDNQVKLVTAKRRRKKGKLCQRENSKENTRRKRKSPLQQVHVHL